VSMNPGALNRLLIAWANKNYGVFPPYWVLSTEDFRSVVHEMTAWLVDPLEVPESDIKSFRFMNVVIVPYDGAMCLEGQAYAPRGLAP
jgi:hypothetical protein